MIWRIIVIIIPKVVLIIREVTLITPRQCTYPVRFMYRLIQYHHIIGTDMGMVMVIDTIRIDDIHTDNLVIQKQIIYQK
jgi:hypothetical protein